MRVLERSLSRNSRRWATLADRDGIKEEDAWRLLSWVELSASAVVREHRAELVGLAAFVFALLEKSPLDRRDVQVVASLVRAASRLANTDFGARCKAGLARAGAQNSATARWLLTVADEIPPTHQALGDGESFKFERLPVGFDPVELEERLLRQQREQTCGREDKQVRDGHNPPSPNLLSRPLHSVRTFCESSVSI